MALEWSLISTCLIILFWWYLSNAYCAIYTKEIVLINSWIGVMDSTLAEFLMGIVWSSLIVLYRNEDIFLWRSHDILTSSNILIGSLSHMLGSFLLCCSYNLLPASISQILKATDPIFTVILSYLIDNKSCTSHTFLSLCYIVIGVTTCGNGNGDNHMSLLGIIVTMLSNIFMPLRTILCKKITNTKYSPYQSYLITSIISTISFLPLYLIFYLYLFLYPSAFILDTSSSSQKTLSQYLSLIFFAGMLHAWYNISAFCFLDLVSPVTYSVANLCKRIVSILLAMMFFHEIMTFQTFLSLVILFVGVGVYITSTMEPTTSIYYQHLLCGLLICFLHYQ